MKSNLKNFLFREKVIASLRQYFDQKNFQNITLPLLYPSLPLEPNIYSFPIDWPYLKDKLYLATSPEMGLKLLMDQGLKNCYSITQNFRVEEAKSSIHQPEFTMLEFYQNNSDYLETMSFLETMLVDIIDNLELPNYNRTTNLFSYQNSSFSLKTPLPRLSFIQLFKDAGFHEIPDNEPDINKIFLNHIEPRLPKDTPFFITDYPAFMSPLAEPHNSNPSSSLRASAKQSGLNKNEIATSPTTPRNDIQTAQRFELYFAGIEIANGCTENSDPELIKKYFQSELDFRLKNNLPVPPVSQDFINASSQLKHFSGCGLGVDRLAMILANVSSLDEIRPFTL